MKSSKTMSVPEAGKTYYGLCPNASYDAARRGEIPVIKVGRLLRVPIAAMERKMAEASAPQYIPPPVRDALQRLLNTAGKPETGEIV